ncbi:S1 family peptidase [Cupriavidus sp. CP313]
MHLRRLPVLLGLFAVAATPAMGMGVDQLTASVSPSVYAVRTYGQQEAPLGSGSGVVVGPGQIVTACNVLAGARTIAVRRENVSYGATLEAPDVERNLCLLKVANLSTPAVQLAVSAAPGFGQKVFAAAVSGAGIAVREGTVAGLQAGTNGKLDRIEASLARDAAVSGGGLFDENGRLVGILTDGTSAAETRQRAVPASWIPEIRTRGAAAVASYAPGAGSTQAAAAPVAGANHGAADAGGNGSPRVGEVWRYRLTDNLTKSQREVLYRVDRIDNDRVIFNQGARIEYKDGRIDRISTAVGGEYEVASPPGGWIPANLKVGNRWKLSYRQAGTGYPTELEGVATGESTIRVAAGTYRTIRIAYEGYVQRPFYGFGSGGIKSIPYKLVVWYAPELARVVQFTASFVSGFERTSETLELVEHRIE